MGRHYLERDGRPFVPVGAHVVPVEGPDWPGRVGASTFDTYFHAMSAMGLDAARIDLLWSAVEPSRRPPALAQPPSRRRRLAVLAGGVLAAVLIGAVVILLTSGRPRRTTPAPPEPRVMATAGPPLHPCLGPDG